MESGDSARGCNLAIERRFFGVQCGCISGLEGPRPTVAFGIGRQAPVAPLLAVVAAMYACLKDGTGGCGFVGAILQLSHSSGPDEGTKIAHLKYETRSHASDLAI